MVAVIIGAKPDLGGARHIDDALGGGAGKHGAMVEPCAVIRPGVTMGVELHQRQRAMLFRMRPEQRIGHRMITAKAEHHGT